MLNSEFSLEMAQRLAGKEADEEVRHWILKCFEAVLGRPATVAEAEKSVKFVREQAEQMRDVEKQEVTNLVLPIIPEGKKLESEMDAYEGASMVLYCLGLYNLSEFVFVD